MPRKKNSQGRHDRLSDHMAQRLESETILNFDVRADHALAAQRAKNLKHTPTAQKCRPNEFAENYPYDGGANTGTQLTFKPSHLRRAMILFNLVQADVARLFGVTGPTVHKWVTGHRLIPVGVAHYFQMRTNELLRAYAHGMGFGIASDIDADIQRQITKGNIDNIHALFLALKNKEQVEK